MQTLNVICVDDQREVLSAVVADLDSLSHWVNIEDCESAAEAWGLIDELDSEGESVAVVISDHVMPGQTGVEFLSELNRDDRFTHTKKVLLTGQATHGDTISAINGAGIQHYFEKPWNSDDLVIAVRKLLTQFVFDSGIDPAQFQNELDQQELYQRLR